ncbi:Clavaminate synthase-like protein At3g21360 [Linum perenne]
MKDKYPELVMKLEEKGLLFIRVMADEDDPSIALGRGWKSTFSTHDTIVAEERYFSYFKAAQTISVGVEIRTVRPDPVKPGIGLSDL